MVPARFFEDRAITLRLNDRVFAIDRDAATYLASPAARVSKAWEAAKLKLGVDPLGGAAVAFWPRIAERYQLDFVGLVENSMLDTATIMTNYYSADGEFYDKMLFSEMHPMVEKMRGNLECSVCWDTESCLWDGGGVGIQVF